MSTVQQYRADLDELIRIAARDLAVLWRSVSDGDQGRRLLVEVLPLLGDTYGSAAATLAADWYDELRDELEVPRRFRATIAVPEIGRSEVLARWAVEPMFRPEPDLQQALRNAEGGMQRMIADAGRDTVIRSAIADPSADGWMRSASGGCDFCRMLASRGAVYSESTVTFGSHDNCRCTAVPAFGGRERPVKAYTPGPGSTPADRARTRAWMRANGY